MDTKRSILNRLIINILNCNFVIQNEASSMIFRVKNLIFLGSLVIIGLMGWYTYSYFFDMTVAHVSIAGLEPERYYSGDTQCIVTSDKRGEITLSLDGQPINNKLKSCYKNQERVFTIPTRTLTHGKHHFKAEFVDATFHKNKTVLEYDFYVDNIPLQAAFVKSESDLKVLQGRTLHLQFQVNKPIAQAAVQTLANTYTCFPESKNSLVYECFIPIACEEAANEYLLAVDMIDHVGNKLHLDNKFQVVLYPFKKERLSIDAEKIKQEELAGQSFKLLEEQVEHIVKNSPPEKLWRGNFCAPIDISRVTCDFGTIRTTQHKGRYPHKAVDVISLPKSVVWAPQDGVVVLKDRFDASGNTVILDHGCGIISMFYHLDDFAKISVGDKVAKGNPIGTLGKTGYATGYHLHWEMRINNIPVDPLEWTRSTF